MLSYSFKLFFIFAFLLLEVKKVQAKDSEKNDSGKTHIVTQKNKKFSTKSLKVKIGDTIIFKNDEIEITHNLFSISPENEFEIRFQKPGNSTALKIDGANHRKGIMEVMCAVHPNMRIKVEIEE